MKLTLRRTDYTTISTIGDFYVGEEWFSFCLEDMVRAEGVKVKGKTAIPAGRYQVTIDQSMRFRRAMPHILDVPNFEGVRIHQGNYAKDTEGCVLLGYTKDKDFVGKSVAAFNAFFGELQDGLLQGECWITIENKEA